jgi:hypothetical protein
LTHSSASSFDFVCISQNPATSSFASANGPSMTVALPPENLTRAPRELGCNPSPASMTPAFTDASFCFTIARRRGSSAIRPVSVYGSALSMTTNRFSPADAGDVDSLTAGTPPGHPPSRISISSSPLRRGRRLTHSIASCFDSTSMIVNVPTAS